MRRYKTITGGLAAIALLTVAATPAAARRHGPPPPPPRHHHHDNTGDVIGTVAAVGIAALIFGAIASSSSKKKAEQARYDDPPPPPYDDRYDGRYDDRYDRDYGYDDRGPGTRYDGAIGPASQDEAVDACVLAARDKATVEIGYGEVREVAGVRPLGNGWDVSGTLVARENFRAMGQLRDFRCTFQDGRVNAVSFR